ncbi:hypothetical protein PR048_016023 [Dryococelus australis]|uniref:Uncharacterized protein n=1 Tax=Dryococelus australis TaxID=614101 RepID=A0ABQ9HJ46_9NEOP|nr:hypothetical protein PR048_016023 [Dryococelus australis]
MTRPTRGMKTFLLNDRVMEAEILCCIQCAMTHRSEIASKLQLQRDKIGYCITFGLALYFRDEVSKMLEGKHMVIGFDESLNKVSQKQQMNITVRFWDSKYDGLVTRYHTSVFLGRSTASHLLTAFKSGIINLFVSNVIQVSMDMPNVNFKLLRELKNDISLSSPEQLPEIRALYTSFTVSEIFPKKCCAIIWVENSSVAQGALEIFSNIIIFVKEVEKDRKLMPLCGIYKIVAESMLPAKLAFFKALATDIEPFLSAFQSDFPLVPFFHSLLSSIIHEQMEYIVKKDTLKSSTFVHKIDVNRDENFQCII